MKRVLVDTNVVIDVLGKRTNFYEDGQDFFTYALDNGIELIVSALSFANTHYILSVQLKLPKIRTILLEFKSVVKVVSFDDGILDLSLGYKFKDFEDGIQYYTAVEHSCEAIISRNKKDFKSGVLPVLTPREFLHLNQ